MAGWFDNPRASNDINRQYQLRSQCPFSGIFEPYRRPGEQVAAGDLAGQLYSTEEVERDDVLAII